MELLATAVFAILLTLLCALFVFYGVYRKQVIGDLKADALVMKNLHIFDNISDLLKGSDLSQYGNLGTGGIAGSVNPAGLADAVSQTAENTGSAAENTDRIAGSVEMSNEELQWLREIAEREVINRYTTAEIRVEMNNNNTIASDMDIDGVVSLFEAKVAEALDISEEGVHN